jgi:hypothetical protein
MSHHFDSPTTIADGRINPCDFYLFPAAPGTTALILPILNVARRAHHGVGDESGSGAMLLINIKIGGGASSS